MALEAQAIKTLEEPTTTSALVEQLTLLSGQSIQPSGMSESTAPGKAVEVGTVSADGPTASTHLLNPLTLESEKVLSLTHLEHPVTAYLNGLAPSSRRPSVFRFPLLSQMSAGEDSRPAWSP